MKVLVPTDFSVYSNAALRLAEMLPGDITLLNVVRDLTKDSSLPAALHGNMAQLVETTTKENLKLLQQLKHNHPKVKEILLEKGIEHQIINRIRAEYDLTVMGTRGASGLAGLILGSVSLKVLRADAGPVITVRDKVPDEINKIVVGVDGSEASLKALSFVQELKEHMPALEIMAVSVFPSEAPGPDVQSHFQAMVKRYLAQNQCASCHAVPGKSPARGLVEFAEQQNAQIIGLGTRGLSGIRDVLGSTTLSVLQIWQGPVLVI